MLVTAGFARKFRSKGLPWGAFQGMQAAVIHLAIALLALAANLLGDASRSTASLLFMLAVLLLLYSVWGAWDTMFGEDFRYIGIDRLLHRVSQSNLNRRQPRRRFRFTSGPEPYVPTPVERQGSAIAHGSGLLFGVPLILLGYGRGKVPGQLVGVSGRRQSPHILG